jgi:hypothetical protein
LQLAYYYPDLLPTIISSLMLRSSTTIRLMMMGLLFGGCFIGIRPDSVLMILR